MNAVRDLLVQTGEFLARNHGPTQLAVTARGVRCRPVDPRAAAWSTAGALCKLAPGASVSDRRVWADHTSIAWDAWVLLEQAAAQHGYLSSAVPVEGDPTGADRAGLAAVQLMFRQAVSLAEVDQPRPRRGRGARRSGSSPRGHDKTVMEGDAA